MSIVRRSYLLQFMSDVRSIAVRGPTHAYHLAPMQYVLNVVHQRQKLMHETGDLRAEMCAVRAAS